MYTVAAKEYWMGRTDSESVTEMFRLHQVVRIENLATFNEKQKENAIGIIGFRCDEGVRRNKGRTGAYYAPDAIRKSLSSLPYNFHSDIKLFDFGNVSCDDGNLEEAQKELGEAIKKILDLNIFPLIIGGGHEVAYGHFLGHKKYKKDIENIGIINFDAHFDMRSYDETTSSGTMFKQIADEFVAANKTFRYLCVGIQKSGNTKYLFETAERYRCEYIREDEISLLHLDKVSKKIDEFIAKSDTIMLTLCSDVFCSSDAPGVSAPQPFGLDPKIVKYFLKDIVKHKKVLSFDIAEINPTLDESGLTVKLAATMLYEIIDSLA